MRSSRKRTGVAAACSLLTLAGLAAASTPGFCTPDGTGKTISLDVAGGDLHAVVSTLEHQANVEALVRDGDSPYKPVNVHLEDASLAKALRTIAFSAGARVSTNSDGVYVFEPENDNSDSAPDSSGDRGNQPDSAGGNAAGAPPLSDDPEARFAPGSLQYRSIVLQNAVPTDILKLMHWDKDVVDMDPFKPLRLPISRPAIMSTQPVVIQQAAEQPYYNNGYSNNGYSNNGYPSVPMGTGNEGPAAANYSAHRSAEPNSPDQANQFPGGFGGGGFNGGGGFGQGGFNRGGGNPFQQGAGGFTPQPFQPGGANQRQQAPLPAGVARIYALQSTNSLLVEATPDGFNLVKSIVKILDVAPRQVSIKVEFVTASVTDVDALGVNFDLVPYPGLEASTGQGSGSFGGVISSISPTFLQYATGNIVAQLYQTLTRTRGKVVQAPLVTTTNNVEASIQITTEIPFFTASTTTTGGLTSTPVNSQQANFLPLQTGLDVTPRINSNDTITMNLAPTITDTTGQASVQGIPPTVSQSLTTLRTVRSGETMVLGGLVRKQETASSQRIPILSDIPILGGLFRTRNKQVNDQELLIFVTPTIINDTDDTTAGNGNGGLSQNATVTP